MAKKEIVDKRGKTYPEDNSGFTVPYFCERYLFLNGIEQLLFGMAYSYGYINMTLDQLCKKFGFGDEKTVRKYLTKMVQEGVMEKRIIPISGNTKRTIYTNRYNKQGERSELAIRASLDEGEKYLKMYYGKKRILKDLT